MVKNLMLTKLLCREFKVTFSQYYILLQPLCFILIAVSLFPFAIGNNHELLKKIGVGVIFVVCLLSSLINTGFLWQDDLEDGSLEQIILAGASRSAIITAKIISHWLVTILPILVLLPIIGSFYQLLMEQIGYLALALVLAAMANSIIINFAAILTLQLKKTFFIITIITLPITISIIILAISLINNFMLVQWVEAGRTLSLIIAIIMIILPVTLLLARNLLISN